MADTLEFRVRSGGTVSIALEQCVACEAKACVKVCEVQGGPLVLDAERGVPTLRWSLAEIERGGCVECLGCELDCELYGPGGPEAPALTIRLPLDRLEEYLASLTAPVVYKR